MVVWFNDWKDSIVDPSKQQKLSQTDRQTDKQTDG